MRWVALDGMNLGEAEGRKRAVSALEDMSEQARGNRQETHRFPGVLIGGKERGLS